MKTKRPWLWPLRQAGGWVRGCGVALWSAARSAVLDPVSRRHLAIVVAALLVCTYAGGILCYVSLTPELGIRCAFTPVVNHFYPEFLVGEDQQPLQLGDTILQIGHQRIENWPQLLRAQIDLNRQQPDPADPRAVEFQDGHKVFRVRAQRSDGTEHVVWCRLGPPPAATLVPSLLWFFLKIGLFAVGAIVFWKRPEEPYAGLFFLLCIVSLRLPGRL